MQSFIDRYIEQGINQGQRLGEATALLRQMERKLGPPSDSVRDRVLAADSDTLAHQLVDQLPAGATWEDLMREIYVRAAIEKGLEESRSGRTKDVAEIRRKYGLPE